MKKTVGHSSALSPQPSALSYRLLLLCMAVFTLLLPASTAQGQQPAPITITVEAGFGGTYRIREWFPVHVTVANDGPDVRGWLEWRVSNQSQGRFRQDIELPRGSRKQVTFYAIAEDYTSDGAVALVENNRDLAVQRLRVDVIDSDQLLVGVVSSDPGLLNSLTSVQSAGFRTSFVNHIGLARLPEQPRALQPLSLLVLHDQDTATLTNAQRRALALWVDLGGHLVVSGGSSAKLTAAGVADLLPVSIGDGFAQASLQPLANVSATAGTQLAGEITVNQVTPLPDSTTFPKQTDSALIYQRQAGAGSVTFSTFDLGALRSWGGEADMWEQVLDLQPHNSLSSVSRQQQFSALDDVLQLRTLVLLPVPVLFGLLALYILAIGPINYLVLRRLNRLNWAWLTIPLIVVTFVGASYMAGRITRGTEIQLAQVTVVQGREGSKDGLFTSYNGLFSPSRDRYTLGSPGALIDELRSFDDPPGGEGVVVNGDQGGELRDTLVNIGAIRTVLVEGMTETGVDVASTLQSGNGRISGEVRYQGSLPLEDAVIVRDRAAQFIGTLQPGGSSAVDLDLSLTDFPWSLSLAEQNSIDRQQLLTRLADVAQYNQALTDPSGVYVFGWRPNPTVDLTINTQLGQAQGVTLYVIRLNN
ncbi:MAG: hypothetical protein H7Z42_08085 [Roseiflexaceae bacterium]|nr:hypothetical protein [Roseiflexaceae bacterium]